MSQRTTTPTRNRSRHSNSSWFERKINRIRSSRQAQKQLKNLVIILAAVMIAFVLGFYFFGPSFSSGE